MNSRFALASLLCISLFYIDCIHHPSESVISEKEKAVLAEQVRYQWITFVSELPKTATGKIQKYVLRGRASAISTQ